MSSVNMLILDNSPFPLIYLVHGVRSGISPLLNLLLLLVYLSKSIKHVGEGLLLSFFLSLDLLLTDGNLVPGSLVMIEIRIVLENTLVDTF